MIFAIRKYIIANMWVMLNIKLFDFIFVIKYQSDVEILWSTLKVTSLVLYF
jgi:hypothetical protein